MADPRPRPGLALRPDIVFVDVESSGLEDTSFPVEVGTCDDGLCEEAWLVRPHAGWSGRTWSPAAQAIHGLTLDGLRRDGRRAEEVVAALDARLSGRLVVSDAPGFDGAWLSTLYAAVGRETPFVVRDAMDAFAAFYAGGPGGRVSDAVAAGAVERWRLATELGERLFPATHRAGDDALSLAAVFRMGIDPDFAARAGAYAASLDENPGGS